MVSTNWRWLTLSISVAGILGVGIWQLCAGLGSRSGSVVEAASAEGRLREASQHEVANRGWPNLFGPYGNSISTERGIVTAWRDEGPTPQWRVKIGTGYSAP